MSPFPLYLQVSVERRDWFRWLGWGSSVRVDLSVNVKYSFTLKLGTGGVVKSVPYLSLATSHGDVDEPPRVRYSLLGATLGGLLLLLWLNLVHHT